MNSEFWYNVFQNRNGQLQNIMYGAPYFCQPVNFGLTNAQQNQVTAFLQQQNYLPQIPGGYAFTLPQMLDYGYPNKMALLQNLSAASMHAQQYQPNVLPYLNNVNSYVIDNVEKSRLRAKSKGAGADSILFNTQKKKPASYERLYEDALTAYRSLQGLPMECIPPSIDTSRFKNVKNEDLIAMFEPDKFYKLGKEGVLALLQEVSSRYCQSFDVEPCEVAVDDLGQNWMGVYRPRAGHIAISRQKLDEYDKKKNFFLKLFDPKTYKYYPLSLLKNIIHESRHRVQNIMEVDPKNKFEETLEAGHANYIPSSENYKAYYYNPVEMDARDAAMEMIKKYAIKNNSKIMQDYYNELVRKEKAASYAYLNNKPKFSEDEKVWFSNVLRKKKFSIGKEQAREKDFISSRRAASGRVHEERMRA